MNKKELRKYLKNIELSDSYINNASLCIEDKVINSKEFKKASSVFIYIATTKEVKTDKIINEAFKQNKDVYVPKCLDVFEMVAVKINSFDELKEGKYGILEPIADDTFDGNIDLSVIPCMSCSKDLKRIGHGKGYYDRYLSRHKTHKMALCFKKLLSHDIPIDENDILMDEVISEN